jgi:hypothetical protein
MANKINDANGVITSVFASCKLQVWSYSRWVFPFIFFEVEKTLLTFSEEVSCGLLNCCFCNMHATHSTTSN